ncbi:hypothetical protein C4901_07530 [Acidiferrobacter sp. SPIII_3]|jgi:glycosyltransferase involved in cell wall biosynthesis|uniref:glycosyltransferase family 2 protein n=1 Tax=Acidiferrobacter sp. SPIII_3 TaxID=1281578 RepID=UPI000D72D492|nr:hypothetical protein C4901_07530 [Acidiferrobacter sp. SPIII_3]
MIEATPKLHVAPKISVVVPVKNGGDFIYKTLQTVSCALADLQAEVIVVTNGSSDDTADEAQEAARSLKAVQIRVIVVTEPIGKAGALLLGFSRCVADRIGFIDGDLGDYRQSVMASDIRTMAIMAANDACVIAQRSHRTCPYRAFISRVYNTYARVLFSLDVSDAQCGIKFFPINVIRNAPAGTLRGGLEIDVRILSLVNLSGYRIRIHTIDWDTSASLNIIGAVRFAALVGVPMALRLLRLRATLPRFVSQ